jgi:hypothetical protein
MIMSTLQFAVEGSSGDIYIVKAGSTGAGNAWITCTCPAGENRQYCKHRFALLGGDITSLATDNHNDVEQLRDLVAGSDIARWLARVAECEKAVAAAQSELKAAKRALARSMHE